jgi:hypothetical protein
MQKGGIIEYSYINCGFRVSFTGEGGRGNAEPVSEIYKPISKYDAEDFRAYPYKF